MSDEVQVVMLVDGWVVTMADAMVVPMVERLAKMSVGILVV